MFEPQPYVDGLLKDTSIINFTGDKTAHYIHAVSPISPYIEYEFLDENGAVYEEGKEISTEFYLQIDIFSKEGYFNSLANSIKIKLINAGFCKSTCRDFYETDTRLYHKALRFYFYGDN